MQWCFKLKVISLMYYKLCRRNHRFEQCFALAVLIADAQAIARCVIRQQSEIEVVTEHEMRAFAVPLANLRCSVKRAKCGERSSHKFVNARAFVAPVAGEVVVR